MLKSLCVFSKAKRSVALKSKTVSSTSNNKNLYNIKKRAMAALTAVALNELGEYGG